MTSCVARRRNRRLIVPAFAVMALACQTSDRLKSSEPKEVRDLAYVMKALGDAKGGPGIATATTLIDRLTDSEREGLAVELGQAVDEAPNVELGRNNPADVLRALTESRDPHWDVAKALIQFYVQNGERSALVHVLRHVCPVSWPHAYIEEVVVFRFGDKKPENIRILLEAARTARGAKSKRALIDALKRSLCAAGVFAPNEPDEAVVAKTEGWLTSRRSSLVLNNGYEPTECSQIIVDVARHGED